jgi:hypothetical protein
MACNPRSKVFLVRRHLGGAGMRRYCQTPGKRGGKMVRHTVILASAFALLPTVSLADSASTWPAISKIGLDGSWAISCTTAPSNANPRVAFFIDASGHVARSIDRGAGTQSLNLIIDSAQVLSETQIQLHARNDDPNWRNSNGVAFDLVIEVTNAHLRALQSTRSDGKVQIKDGAFTSDSKPAPLMEKCPK